jgi:23S rRNA C2498 (ribose-2'-O)-methylase RlmM
MAEEILVDKKLEDGKKLIQTLQSKHFDVSAAFWMQIDDGLWHLYLVSKDTGIGAFDKVLSELQQLGETSIDSSEIVLSSTGTPVAKEVLDLQRQFRLNLYSRQRLRKLGGLQTAEAHIYPLDSVP